MDFIKELKTIYQLAKPRKGDTHAEKMESFYKHQAEHYDEFRKRLLPDRTQHFSELRELRPRGTWVDLGAGTGINLTHLKQEHFHDIFLVDLSPSLLKQARSRVTNHSATQIHFIEEDASTFQSPQPCQLVTLSFSLTMIPDWMTAVDNAKSLLTPGGLIAVMDFHIPPMSKLTSTLRKFSSQTLWPTWFAWDGVYLNRDHVRYLQKNFETVSYTEDTHRLPYLPLSQVPYYYFIGRKK